MQSHTVHHAGHRKFSNTCLEELTRKVALHKGLGLIEETIGTIRITQVGRCYDHILDLVGINTEHCSRCNTRCRVGLNLNLIVINLRNLARQEAVELE